MKFTAADLPRIQLSLASALIAMLLGTAAVLYALDSEKSAVDAKNKANREFREFDGKLKQVRNEENEIKQKAALFEKLQSRGIIGEERRLDWIELLKRIHEQRRLAELEYELAPQHPLDVNPGTELAYYASTMKLQAKLLHEEDLLRLLADLRSQAQALILVKNCKLNRLAANSDHAGSQTNLQADCEIDWVTVHSTAKP